MGGGGIVEEFGETKQNRGDFRLTIKNFFATCLPFDFQNCQKR